MMSDQSVYQCAGICYVQAPQLMPPLLFFICCCRLQRGGPSQNINAQASVVLRPCVNASVPLPHSLLSPAMHGTNKGSQVTVLALLLLPDHCSLLHCHHLLPVAHCNTDALSKQLLLYTGGMLVLKCCTLNSCVLQRSPTHVCSKEAPLSMCPKEAPLIR